MDPTEHLLEFELPIFSGRSRIVSVSDLKHWCGVYECCAVKSGATREKPWS